MMLVDCTTCPVRDVHCADCMVTALDALDAAAGGVPQPTSLSLTRRTPTRSGLASVGAEGVPETGGEAGTEACVLPLDRAERRAVSVLLGAGLVSVGGANAARAVPSSSDGLADGPVHPSRGGLAQRPPRAPHGNASSASPASSASSAHRRGRAAG